MILKKADKNLGCVVVALERYNNEVQRQLSDRRYYTRVDRVPFETALQAYNVIIEMVRTNQEDLIDGMLDFLEDHPAHSDREIPQFYLNPKIHKSPWEGRPVVQQVQWYTTPLAIVISDYFKRYIDRFGTDIILANSLDLVNLLDIFVATPDIVFSTGDVKAMYTNIQHSQIVDAFNYLWNLDKANDKPICNNTEHVIILEMLDYCFKYSYFTESSFGSFCQDVGIFMGCNMSKEAANLVGLVQELQTDFQSCCLIYQRYVDDLFVVKRRGSPWPATLLLDSSQARPSTTFI